MSAPGSTLATLLACALIACTAACSTARQSHSAPKVNAPLLESGLLEDAGLAFLTPVAGGGNEEDKNALALVFAEVLSNARPQVRIVPLAQTLGAVNRAGLGHQYQRMYEGFRGAGVLDRDTLARLRGLTGARYFALLQLSEFRQELVGGPSLLGIQMRPAQSAHIRLFLQIWDSSDGIIVWEGINEVTFSDESPGGRGVTFSAIVERAARELIEQIP